mmetsp:Transcript_81349/g.235908  ORF Transcript_81349/g.235908 Transcript_81349/m.235908 type:complete len:203 (+) Transcript_81349:3046-3654(+)
MSTGSRFSGFAPSGLTLKGLGGRAETVLMLCWNCCQYFSRVLSQIKREARGIGRNMPHVAISPRFFRFLKDCVMRGKTSFKTSSVVTPANAPPPPLVADLWANSLSTSFWSEAVASGTLNSSHRCTHKALILPLARPPPTHKKRCESIVMSTTVHVSYMEPKAPSNVCFTSLAELHSRMADFRDRMIPKARSMRYDLADGFA